MALTLSWLCFAAVSLCTLADEALESNAACAYDAWSQRAGMDTHQGHCDEGVTNLLQTVTKVTLRNQKHHSNQTLFEMSPRLTSFLERVWSTYVDGHTCSLLAGYTAANLWSRLYEEYGCGGDDLHCMNAVLEANDQMENGLMPVPADAVFTFIRGVLVVDKLREASDLYYQSVLSQTHTQPTLENFVAMEEMGQPWSDYSQRAKNIIIQQSFDPVHFMVNHGVSLIRHRLYVNLKDESEGKYCAAVLMDFLEEHPVARSIIDEFKIMAPGGYADRKDSMVIYYTDQFSQGEDMKQVLADFIQRTCDLAPGVPAIMEKVTESIGWADNVPPALQIKYGASSSFGTFYAKVISIVLQRYLNEVHADSIFPVALCSKRDFITSFGRELTANGILPGRPEQLQQVGQ